MKYSEEKKKRLSRDVPYEQVVALKEHIKKENEKQNMVHFLK